MKYRLPQFEGDFRENCIYKGTNKNTGTDFLCRVLPNTQGTDLKDPASIFIKNLPEWFISKEEIKCELLVKNLLGGDDAIKILNEWVNNNQCINIANNKLPPETKLHKFFFVFGIIELQVAIKKENKDVFEIQEDLHLYNTSLTELWDMFEPLTEEEAETHKEVLSEMFNLVTKDLSDDTEYFKARKMLLGH